MTRFSGPFVGVALLGTFALSTTAWPSSPSQLEASGDPAAMPAHPVTLTPGDSPRQISGDLRLASRTSYALTSTLQVGPGATLVIEAGARVEAGPGGGIVIERGARILADGTLFEPIVFTCAGAVSPGCWEGVRVLGNARINAGSPTSPVVAGRDGTGGCLARPLGSTGATYGGCNDADSSGVLRHLRIEGAGDGGVAALALLGVGGGTVVEDIHINEAAGPGVHAFGGLVDLRRVRINGAWLGLDYDGGWRGRGQYMVVQTVATSAGAIHGRSNPAEPAALPRSAPVLRNVTILGPPEQGVAPEAASIRLSGGTDAVLRAFLVMGQPGVGAFVFDVDDDATWTRFHNGHISFRSSIFAGFDPLGDLDDDPGTDVLFSPDVEGQHIRQPTGNNHVFTSGAVIDELLVAPWGELQDLRPLIGGLVSQSDCDRAPAGDPFFEIGDFCGAVRPSVFNEVPWTDPTLYVDRTAVPSSPSPGHLRAEVIDQNLIPRAGVIVRVNEDGARGVTGVDGLTRMYSPPGLVGLSVRQLPPNCTSGGLIIVTVPAGGQTGFVRIQVNCS